MARINPKVTGRSQTWLLGTHTTPFPLGWLLSGSCNTNRGNKYPVKNFREKNFPEPALLGIMDAIQFHSYIAGLQGKFQAILTKIIFNNNKKIYCEAHRLGKLQKVLKQSSHCHGKENADTHSLQYHGILDDSVLVFPAALYSKVLLQKASHWVSSPTLTYGRLF